MQSEKGNKTRHKYTAIHHQCRGLWEAFVSKEERDYKMVKRQKDCADRKGKVRTARTRHGRVRAARTRHVRVRTARKGRGSTDQAREGKDSTDRTGQVRVRNVQVGAGRNSPPQVHHVIGRLLKGESRRRGT